MALADDIFVGFDVSDGDKPFLLNVLLAPGTPWDEKLAIYDLGLFSGYEDWNLMLESAASMKEKDLARSPLDARDILAYIPRVKEATLAAEKLRQGWAATDQSIKNLAALLRVHRSGHAAVESQPQPQPQLQSAAIKKERVIKREAVAPKRGREDGEDEEETEPKQRVKRHRTAPKPSTSHYFAPPADEQSPRTSPELQSATPSPAGTPQTVTSAVIRNGIATPNPTPRKQSRENEAPKESTTTGRDPLHSNVKTPNAGPAASETNDDSSNSRGSSGGEAILAVPVQQPISDELVRILVPRGTETGQVRELAPPEPSPRRKTAVKSPFFGQPQTKPSPRSKRVGGLVSTIPFPPLSAPHFGLIQEEFAHEPFWLLVVVTFLVKTAGTLAIPTFYKVKERFPTPAALADPEAATTIMGMIHHLGLSVVRTAAIQRYARVWIEKPPTAGVVYRVKNYDKRDVELESLRPSSDEDSLELTAEHAGEADEAWEMGHFTQGKYALDSWRIFCRDELLGRAEDWNGKSAAPNFQPEWMRVRPDDKELRACLRWMWMREGWEWDPVTGEKMVLRDAMRRAVNEGRVDYDDVGGLVILDEPRSG
ncbi:methyl-CpG-binding domain-containing protein 4 [Colletotrichum tofieldiae]|uniref:Methyl-CpG-binding domain-containing protein 4 n=1 Tax=Colletotrichum tofieldiae TaxID=708197 RepID=A0A166WVH9_9PEZI|nr:methyl-CpG-binding domain-containing protein 4 [Colletotrichum tofieldiae]